MITRDEQTGSIDITNLNWNEYKKIMFTLDRSIKLLSIPLNDAYLDQNRIQLLADYQQLFSDLTLAGIPWQGQAFSLAENIFDAATNKI
jgi:hypothetical protein